MLDRRERKKQKATVGLINMLGNVRPGDYKAEIAYILKARGRNHAIRNKKISNATFRKRSGVIYLSFKQIRDMGFKLQSIRNIKPKHLIALFEKWDEEELSTSTLQQRHSILGVFLVWIDKSGMLPPLKELLSDPSRARRNYIAIEDRSWLAKNIDVDEKIREIALIDPRVAVQVELQIQFGLRVREAIMFKPNGCITMDGSSILLKQGTKGGRPRTIPVETERQRETLARAQALVGQADSHISDPTKTLTQNMRRFRYVMERVGVRKGDLGITPHGLRHQYANDRYEALSGGKKTPVRGGERGDLLPSEEATIRLQIAEELGHSRIQITTAYCGAHPRRKE